MRRFLTLVCGVLVFLCAQVALCCSCSNGTPIQKALERYRDRAVFTAHVVQLMGGVGNLDGKRISGQVLAVVRQRYWGLPSYWPKVVILDGGFFCNIALEEGQDYLVSGWRGRYGVLDVSGCSRTQPLETAQLDLRTLDGSHCAAPGGTIIGHVYRGEDDLHENPPAPDVSLTFRDQDGNMHSARSDRYGIFELQHLPSGTYTLESHFSRNQYYFTRGNVVVTNGVCGETSALIRDYDISGRLLPGLDEHVNVGLVGVHSPEDRVGADLQPDGEFYFKNAADGEYLLALNSVLQGEGNDSFYPGTNDRRKATRVRIANHAVVGSNQFDFDPEALPFVPIPVALDPPVESGRFYWRILLVTPDNIVAEERWTPGIRFVVPYGLRGHSYGIRLYGDPDYRTANAPCESETVPITAKPGLGVIRIAIPTACR